MTGDSDLSTRRRYEGYHPLHRRYRKMSDHDHKLSADGTLETGESSSVF